MTNQTDSPNVEINEIELPNAINSGIPSMTEQSIFIIQNGLHVQGNILADGTVTATSFIGDGSQLTGITDTGIELTDLSVAVEVAGTANLEYDNTTGVFTYTPPSFDGYLPLSGGTLTGPLNASGIALGDSQKATFGAGADLEIYHEPNNSIIKESGGGSLLIQGDNIRLQKVDGTENMLTAVNDGQLKIFYDGAEKLATTAAGIDVTGTATMDGLTVENTASAVARLETTDTSVIADQEIGALEYSQADASGAGAGVKASIRAKSGNSTGAQTYIAVHASSSSVNDLEVLRVDHTGIDVTGSVTATSFIGDGSQLTGISGGGLDSAGVTALINEPYLRDTLYDVAAAQTNIGLDAGFASTSNFSIAIGKESGINSGNATNSIAIGFKAGQNISDNSIMIGRETAEFSPVSFAVGIGTEAMQSAGGNGAVAIGYRAALNGSGANSVSVGRESKGTGSNSVAIGDLASASGDRSIAMGNNVSATSADAVTIGSSVAGRLTYDGVNDWTFGSGVTMTDLTASGATVLFSNLPIVDPVNAGQLWNDAGTLKVSAG